MTVTVCVMLPAVNVTVAVRAVVEMLVSVDMLMVLLPFPEVRLTIHQDASDDTVQLVFEVTVIVWLLPSASKESVEGVTLSVAAAAFRSNDGV